MMVQQGNKVCFTCHTDKEEAVAVTHKPVDSEKGCLSCHAPHAAANKGLLLKEDKELCFQCHAKTKAAEKAKDVHAAFTDESCTVCHNPHGSNFAIDVQ